jgi:hypothetical protein
MLGEIVVDICYEPDYIDAHLPAFQALSSLSEIGARS